VVLFIIKIMKNQLSPILKLNRVINRIVWLKMVFFNKFNGFGISWYKKSAVSINICRQ
jgi:hypothetical protein